MNDQAASVTAVQAPEPGPALPPSEKLVQVFNELRDELVSTLWFVLGNRHDAQDTAQEAFLKCWRAQDHLPAVRDLRAWIFRVGINAAKDLQRSAWRRHSRTLRGEADMLSGNNIAPHGALENLESLEPLPAAIQHL